MVYNMSALFCLGFGCWACSVDDTRTTPSRHQFI